MFSQNSKPAYLLYHKNSVCSWEKLVAEALKSDIIFFGEYHNNPIHHWLQLELIKELHEKTNGRIIIGAEMFEVDNQLILDEYLQGLIRERNFLEEMKLWKNYHTDYKPIVEFAKEKNIRIIATNIPRRYAAAVNYGGFEALEKFPPNSKVYFPPLPIPIDTTLRTYSMLLNDMLQMPGKKESNMNIVKAQALKDATMSWNILNNLQNGFIFIHLNGAFHTDYKEGIIWYLMHYSKNKNLKILTISVDEHQQITSYKPEQNKADFIIVTPSQLTKTH